MCQRWNDFKRILITLKTFLADFKFHHINDKKRSKTITDEKVKFNCKLEYDIANQKVLKLVNERWESRINLIKNFNERCISPGTVVAKKDNLKKHITSAPHKQAVELSIKKITHM